MFSAPGLTLASYTSEYAVTTEGDRIVLAELVEDDTIHNALTASSKMGTKIFAMESRNRLLLGEVLHRSLETTSVVGSSPFAGAC